MGIIATAAAATSSSGGSSTFLILIVVVFIGFYFLLIRPQRNRQRKVMEQQKTVATGARVRTTAGMYATVVAVDGDDVVLEVAPGVEVRYLKKAIMEVVGEGPGGYAEDQDAEDAEGGFADEETAEPDDETAEPEDTVAEHDGGAAGPAVAEGEPEITAYRHGNGTPDAGRKDGAAKSESAASKE
jgi:preprotein translocase subunit YajC